MIYLPLETGIAEAFLGLDEYKAKNARENAFDAIFNQIKLKPCYGIESCI